MVDEACIAVGLKVLANVATSDAEEVTFAKPVPSPCPSQSRGRIDPVRVRRQALRSAKCRANGGRGDKYL